MTMRMMVDIETLGREVGCPIISIGACIFNDNEVLSQLYYVELDYLHQISTGAKVCKDTLKWWRGQGIEAVGVFNRPLNKESNSIAVQQLNRFYQDNHCKEIWCQGTDFDIPIIRSWMGRYGKNPAWSYGAARDSRTIRRVCNTPKREFEGVEHNALHDAIHQANCVVDCFKEIGR